VGDAVNDASDFVETAEVEFEVVVKDWDVEESDVGAVVERDVVEFTNTELEEVEGAVSRLVEEVEFWLAETEVEVLVEIPVPGAVPEKAEVEEFPPGTLNGAASIADRRISRATLRRLSRWEWSLGWKRLVGAQVLPIRTLLFWVRSTVPSWIAPTEPSELILLPFCICWIPSAKYAHESNWWLANYEQLRPQNILTCTPPAERFADIVDFNPTITIRGIAITNISVVGANSPGWVSWWSAVGSNCMGELSIGKSVC
jgi:hypothetical protein